MKLFKKRKKQDTYEQKVNEVITCIKLLNETMEEYYKEDFIFKLICEKVNNDPKRV